MSCDDNWARGGFQSLYGMGSAIDAETGKVVDFEMKSVLQTFQKIRKISDFENTYMIVK